MLTTALIAFREFFEAFLIVGLFLGVSRNLNLKRETEILLAAALGISVSLLLASITYLFSGYITDIFTERTIELLEGYLMLFSGFFLAYVVFSLHDVMNRGRKTLVSAVTGRLEQRAFDVSLFLLIVFLVVREGFEIALFTASVSLLSAFMQNFLGLLIGLVAAMAIGAAAMGAYIRLPIGKVFQATKYLILLLGASMTQNGVTELLEIHFDIDLSQIGSLPLAFLPDSSSFLGHMLQSLTGIDQELSLARLCIMFVYGGIVYWLFLRKNISSHTS